MVKQHYIIPEDQKQLNIVYYITKVMYFRKLSDFIEVNDYHEILCYINFIVMFAK